MVHGYLKGTNYKERYKLINVVFYTQNSCRSVSLSTRLTDRISSSFENPELVLGDLWSF
jgi:hypothetical protein